MDVNKLERNKEILDNYIDGTLEYYYNPFVKTPQQPKIADGKMNTSIGYQNFYSQEVTFDNQGDIEQNMNMHNAYIIMLPAIMSPFIMNHPIVTATADTPVYTYSNEKLLTDLSQCQFSDTLKGLNTNPMYWRQVSQGLRIMCIESETDSQGYFESVSVPTNTLTKYIQIHTETIPVGTAGQGIFKMPTLNDRFYKDLETAANNWRDSKTYACGTIRDIQKFEFRQVVNDTDHSPTFLQDEYDPTDVVTFARECFDTQFQTRIIRLRFKPGTRFLLNGIQNLEFQFPFNNVQRAFETVNNAEVNYALVNALAEADELNQGVRQVINFVSPDRSAKRPKPNPRNSAKRKLLQEV